MLMWTALAVWLFPTASSYVAVTDVKLWRNWEDAEKYCQSEYKSNLASFHNDADALKLLKLAETNKKTFWIGLNEKTKKGHWIFSDGSGCPTKDDSCTRDVFKYWRDAPLAPDPLDVPNKDCAKVGLPVYMAGVRPKIERLIYDETCDDVIYNGAFICNDPPPGGGGDDDDNDDNGDDDDDDNGDNDDDEGGQVQKTPCPEAGLKLGISHECTCSITCDPEDRFCNTYEFVHSKVGGLVPPDDMECENFWEYCCCSCQNCPGHYV